MFCTCKLIVRSADASCTMGYFNEYAKLEQLEWAHAASQSGMGAGVCVCVWGGGGGGGCRGALTQWSTTACLFLFFFLPSSSLWSPALSLLHLFSLSLGDDRKWPTRVDVCIKNKPIQIQYNLSDSNPDGSFTLDDSNSFFFSPYKILAIAQKKIFREFFLFNYEIVCCVYSLESPHRGDSNEYIQRTIIV